MANTYLTRATSDPQSSNTTATYSVWIKRGALGSDQCIWSGSYYSNDNVFQLKFLDSDKLSIYSRRGASTKANLTTAQVFRDTSAWYHVVIAIDTTQGTEANRIKCYVNGELATVTGSYPSQNQNLYLDAGAGANYYIGRRGDNAEYFNGLMSHFHYVDGTALAATVFGSTDSTTGEWQINTSPSYTVGAKGFFLLKDGNSVTDASANSNNFTVGAGTLTKTEDSPSNVFATWNPLWRSRFDNDGAFVNGNTKVTFQSGDGDRGYGISTIGVTKGKWYWEVKQITDDREHIGVADANFISGLTGIPWDTNNPSKSIGLYGVNGSLYYNTTSNSSYHGSNIPANSIISIALDMDNYLMWYGINGTWLNNATASEIANSTATNDVTTAIGTKNIINSGEPIFAMVNDSSSAGQAGFEANFGNGYFGTTAVSSAGANASGIGIFEYDVPTGYTALSTKGLNL